MTAPEQIKSIDLAEFRDVGFLMELNRQFLHPLGMALCLNVDDQTGAVTFDSIHDFRDNPEGYFFADLSDDEARAKAERVEAERQRHITERIRVVGSAVQPVGHAFPKATS